jgi:tight adherence protein C
METIGLLLALATLAAGLASIGAALNERRRLAGDPADYLRSLEADEEAGDEFDQVLSQSFLTRVVRPIASRSFGTIAGLTPGNHLENVHRQLVHAGLAGRVRAEEVVAAQMLAAAAGLLASIAWVIFGDPSPRLGALALVLVPVVGVLVPQSWLARKVDERKDSIRRDLPDMLDLLSISVEAGMGFEGALDIVCRHFDSPLAQEFSRTLKEMELGLPRREALHNLKRRTEVPELSNFVLTLTQADALGMPIGRVLKTQAGEMRLRRRQWAREKAGKLPVKILFPLVVFIFPAVLIILLGPAASEIVRAF